MKTTVLKMSALAAACVLFHALTGCAAGPAIAEPVKMRGAVPATELRCVCLDLSQAETCACVQSAEGEAAPGVVVCNIGDCPWD